MKLEIGTVVYFIPELNDTELRVACGPNPLRCRVTQTFGGDTNVVHLSFKEHIRRSIHEGRGVHRGKPGYWYHPEPAALATPPPLKRHRRSGLSSADD